MRKKTRRNYTIEIYERSGCTLSKLPKRVECIKIYDLLTISETDPSIVGPNARIISKLLVIIFKDEAIFLNSFSLLRICL